MSTDSVADLLTRVRNALMRQHRAVRVQSSHAATNILTVMQQEGFIEGFETRKDRSGKFDEIEVFLKYGEKRPAIRELIRVSKPGRRVYAKATELPKVHSGLGIAVISTSQGLMADREARRRGIGGEVMAYIS